VPTGPGKRLRPNEVIALEELAIGLAPRPALVYRVLLRRYRWRPVELAAAVDSSIEDTSELIDELTTEGLVTSSADDPQSVRAVEPRLALPALMMRRLRAPLSLPVPVATAIERFISGHERTPDRNGEGVAEGIFEGSPDNLGRMDRMSELMDHSSTGQMERNGAGEMDRISILVERLVAIAKHEVVLLVPRYAPGGFEFSRHVASAAIRRGATLRSLWCLELLSLPPVLAHARWLGTRQAVPRALDRVPVRAMIVDRVVAVVVDETLHARRVWAFAPVESLHRLAGRLWDRAADVRAAGSAVPVLEPESQPRGETVLRLLAEGLTDDAMARRIGVSVRTVRTEVASLMTSLDARSRFQAGLRAAQLGLL